MRSVLYFTAAIWALGSTTLYTLLVVPPILMAVLFSRKGRAPFVFARIWSWMVLKTNRVRVISSGGDQLQPDRSYVFISNHASHLDSPAIALSLPHPLRFIGKMSLSRIPFFGWATRRIGIIYIDRSNPEKAHRTLSEAAASLTGGVSTLFYAEGTRTGDGRLQPFKKGGVMLALQTGLPIVPITVVGSRTLLPKYALRIRPGTIRVIMGPPIETAGKRLDQRDALLETVRGHIQTTLNRYTHETPAADMAPVTSPQSNAATP